MNGYPSTDPPAIPGDPGGVDGIVRNLQGAVDGVGLIQSRMAGSTVESWSGTSNETYLAKLTHFHPNLSSIIDALTGTAGQLSGYSGQLSGWQSVSQQSQQALTAARQNLSSSQGALSAAAAKRDGLANQQAQATDPQHKSMLGKLWGDAKAEATKIENEVAGWVRELENLLKAAWDNFNEYEQEAVRLARHLESSGEHLESIFMQAGATLVRDAGRLGEDGLGVVAGAWRATTKEADKLAQEATQDIDRNFPDIHAILSKVETAATVIGLAAGAVAVGAGMIALLAVPGGGEIADAGIIGLIASGAGGLATGAGYVGLASGGLEVGSDVVAAGSADGNRTTRDRARGDELGDIVNEAYATASFGVGKVVGGPARAVVGKSKALTGELSRFGDKVSTSLVDDGMGLVHGVIDVGATRVIGHILPSGDSPSGAAPVGTVHGSAGPVVPALPVLVTPPASEPLRVTVPLPVTLLAA